MVESPKKVTSHHVEAQIYRKEQSIPTPLEKEKNESEAHRPLVALTLCTKVDRTTRICCEAINLIGTAGIHRFATPLFSDWGTACENLIRNA
jgi:hypothetical protein